MKKILLFVVVTMLAVSTYGQKGKNVQSNIVFEQTEWDFGTVEPTDELVYVFRFKNEGEKPYIIEEIITPCGCTTAKYTRRPVMPGEEGVIEVELEPATFAGMVVRKGLAVYSNNKRSRDIIVVTATVKDKTK